MWMRSEEEGVWEYWEGVGCAGVVRFLPIVFWQIRAVVGV